MKTKVSGSVVFGIVLIAVGVISLLSSLGYLDSYDIYRQFWPVILILFGIKAIIDYRSSTIFGLILVIVGGVLIVDHLGYEFLGRLEMREVIVPLIVILIGLNFILPKSKVENEEEMIDGQSRTVPPVSAAGTAAGSRQASAGTAAGSRQASAGGRGETGGPTVAAAPTPPVPPTPPTPPTPTVSVEHVDSKDITIE